jgi:hypothetical protein
VEAANTFRSVLQSLLLVLAQTPEEESEVSHFARSHRV